MAIVFAAVTQINDFCHFTGQWYKFNVLMGWTGHTIATLRFQDYTRLSHYHLLSSYQAGTGRAIRMAPTGEVNMHTLSRISIPRFLYFTADQICNNRFFSVIRLYFNQYSSSSVISPWFAHDLESKPYISEFDVKNYIIAVLLLSFYPTFSISCISWFWSSPSSWNGEIRIADE